MKIYFSPKIIAFFLLFNFGKSIYAAPEIGFNLLPEDHGVQQYNFAEIYYGNNEHGVSCTYNTLAAIEELLLDKEEQETNLHAFLNVVISRDSGEPINSDTQTKFITRWHSILNHGIELYHSNDHARSNPPDIGGFESLLGDEAEGGMVLMGNGTLKGIIDKLTTGEGRQFVVVNDNGQSIAIIRLECLKDYYNDPQFVLVDTHKSSGFRFLNANEVESYLRSLLDDRPEYSVEIYPSKEGL